jgi:MFS transporter, YNFM family, putative membrane transport protein
MREIIFLLALASANSGIALRAVEPMLPKLADDFGVSVSVAAMVITAYALAYGCSQLTYGPIGDRFGKLKVVTLALVGAAAGSFGCALAQDVTALAAMRFVTALFASSPVMLGMAYIGDHVPIAERQPVLARFIAGTIIGQALGPVVGGAITDWLGWRGAFAILGAVFAGVSLVLFVRTRALWPQDVGTRFSGNPFATYARVFSLSRVRHVVIPGFIETFFFFGAFSFLGAHLKLRFDLSLTLIGVILAGFGIGGVLYTLVVGRLLSRLGQRGLVIRGAAICCGCFVLMALTPVWQITLPCATGLGFSFYMMHNTLQVKATEMAPQARGTGLSLYSSTWALGQAAGVATMGLAIGLFDYTPSIIAFGCGYLVLGIWLRANLDKL